MWTGFWGFMGFMKTGICEFAGFMRTGLFGFYEDRFLWVDGSNLKSFSLN